MESLYKDIELICQDNDIILYDIELTTENKENIFRVYITSKKGVSTKECAHISYLISPLLDLNPPFKGEYRLEVSSPGIERKLKKPAHFINSVGEMIKLTTIDNQNFKGKLIRADEKGFSIEDKDQIKEFSYSQIKKAKTYFQWK